MYSRQTILATKRVIYRNRQKGTPYTLIEVKALLKTQILIEEYQAYIELIYENLL